LIESIYGLERQPVFNSYKAIGEVVHNRDFILGRKVSMFENQMSGYLQMDAVAVSSGTDAEFLLLKALGIGEGDLVYVPAFTFLSTATVVKMVGARPIFIDVDKSDFTMNSLSLENAIHDSVKIGKPKAVVPVDLFGCLYDEEINRIARRYDLIVIEDGCHAVGSKDLDGRKALSLGDHSFTSFYPTKPLGCFGDAGMIFTKDSELAIRLKDMRKHGQTDKYYCSKLGYNARMDTLQAAVLLERFKVYERELERRRAIAERYKSGLVTSKYAYQKSYNYKLTWALFSIICHNRDAVIPEEMIKSKKLPILFILSSLPFRIE